MANKIGSIMHCNICGKQIIRTNPNQRYCPECKKIHTLESAKQSRQKQKELKDKELVSEIDDDFLRTKIKELIEGKISSEQRHIEYQNKRTQK